jgi:ketosteroid isomerase-like protein
MPVSTDDYASISDFFGRYCWRIDMGDAQGWVELWREDGVFAGVTPEPLAGRAALLELAKGAYTGSNGTLRHQVGSLNCDYAEGTRDVAIARYYNLVTNWQQGGTLACLAASTVRLVRHGDSWQIERSDSITLT